MLNVAIATRTRGHGHVSTYVRWLYNLVELLTPPPCLTLSFWGSHQQEPFCESQRGFLAWSGPLAERDEQTHSQAGVLGGAASSKVFADWFPQSLFLATYFAELDNLEGSSSRTRPVEYSAAGAE